MKSRPYIPLIPLLVSDKICIHEKLISSVESGEIRYHVIHLIKILYSHGYKYICTRVMKNKMFTI